MSVLLVGMSHRSAPVAVLERIALSDEDRPRVAGELLASGGVQEAMVVSTCNRVEYYVVADGFHSGLSSVVRSIAARSGLSVDELTRHLYVRYAQGAAEHLLSVASGLDSMVVGEQQILGQIRSSYQLADGAGTVGRQLHELAQRALHTGKRVHTETGIDAAGATVVSVCLDQAAAHLGGLAGRSALLIGAGAMASLAAAHLGRAGVAHVTVANRTVDRAMRLAEHSREAGVDAVGIPLSAAADVLGEVDVVVTATGAMGPVIGVAEVASALGRRGQMGRRGELDIVDLSLPRDVADGVAELPGVTLFDIERIRSAGDTVLMGRDEAAARAIVDEELQGLLTDQRAQDVAPTVTALRRRAKDIVDAELGRLQAKTPELSEHHRREVERSVQRIVDKLLHEPTVQVKKLSAEPGGSSYTEALRRLFGLPLDTAAGLHSDVDLPADLLVPGIPAQAELS